MRQFEEEIARLRVRGGAAEPERHLLRAGIVLAMAGLTLAAFALAGTRDATTVEQQNDYLVLGPLAIGLTLVGVAMWLRHSLTRYFRFWLVRLIYEDRQTADRIVEAIERDRG
jgi:hypothetical protein